MKKKLTELVFILDKSGSMYELTQDTIGGFNSMIEKQKREIGEVLVTTILFNKQSNIVHDRIPIEEVEKLTEKEYVAAGGTALLDAVGSAVRHIDSIHKYARHEDIPERTLFVINTDGMENSSIHYSFGDIKKMIEDKKKKYGWEFLFLGANIDAAEVGADMGIHEDFTVKYTNDKVGAKLNYEVISNAVSQVRSRKRLDKKWKRDIERRENND